MAGDWLPIRYTITDCPKVVRIAQLTNLDHDTVVGKLVRMWRWFGEHTTDGRTTVGAKHIDERVVFCTGFVGACCDEGVKYLRVDGDTVSAVRWEIWNASASKARLKENERKRSERSKLRPVSVRKMSGKCPDSVRDLSAENRTRGEESRGEKRKESGGGDKESLIAADAHLPLAEDAAAAAVFSCLRSFGLDQEGIRRIAAMVPLPALETVEAWVNNIRRRSPQPTNPNGLLLAMLTDRIIPPNGVTPDQEKAIAQVRDTFARVKAKRAAEEARKRRTFI